jgi:hypothetical protein
MRFQLGIQLLLLIIAAAIAFGVIKPKFEDIRVDQNEIASYRSAIENIGRYNQTLQTLLNDYNSLPASDRAALSRYLPESIDVAVVSRDISNIVELNRLLLLDISFGVATPVTTSINEGVVVDPYMAESFGGESTGLVGDVSGVAPSGLYSQTFEVSVVGTYEQMKEMLKDFEQNDYPLRLLNLKFSLDDSSSGLIQYSFTLETYALPAS